MKTFEQEQVGNRYKPHITIGLVGSGTAEQLQAQSMAPMKFTIEAVAIYQLGNIGTARRELWRSPKR